ncbi:hypothetical protein GF359_06350 [candidate division WOR-3 bacterium]|uniref:PEGA domain-containing protein n=1 Tax=candidate division WOR-3 bacterium TaxID=2052148 RepID=A0A9D5KA06_UNCW3|nr:hypothetical protein [candidate division WOR-3 bacterium]MBD3364820.1 hypothetical protein [candidate division WOR-3 bacterium]
MKRLVLMIVLTSLLVPLNAEPTVIGLEGLARVIDARNPGLHNWSVGLSFAGIDHGAEHMNDWNPETWDNSVFRLFGSWVPVEPLELAVAGGMGYSYPQQISGTSPDIGLWDLELSAKYTLPLDYWSVGAAATGIVPIHSPVFGDPEFGADFTLLASTSVADADFHINLGGKLRGRDALVALAAGAEYHYLFLNPYLELSTEAYPGYLPLRLTPGLRIITNTGISFFYAADFGLNSDAQTVDIQDTHYINQVYAGIAFCSADRSNPEVYRSAKLLITVEDEETGNPIPAQVTITDHVPGVFLLGRDGQRLVDVQTGRYEVTVSAPGYEDQVLMANFSALRRNQLNVKMVPPYYSRNNTLTVRILDSYTNKPIQTGSVTIAGINVDTDESGEAEFKLPGGKYEIQACAPGYRTEIEDIKFSADEPLTVKIKLTRS